MERERSTTATKTTASWCSRVQSHQQNTSKAVVVKPSYYKTSSCNETSAATETDLARWLVVEENEQRHTGLSSGNQVQAQTRDTVTMESDAN